MQNDLLRIEKNSDGDHITIVPVGELDLSTAPLLVDHLADAVASRPSRLHVDLLRLTYTDSVGLSVFVTAHFQCLDAGIDLQFLNPDLFIDRVLAMTGLGDVLKITKTNVLLGV